MAVNRIPCEKFNQKDVIDALKICDCNNECVGCEECPIKDKYYNGSWYDDNGDCYIQLMHRAAELLSTQPEPKAGHWIAQDIHNCHTEFKCSECGYTHSFMHLYGKPIADYTYCPKCGAKMVEPQERSCE